MKETSEKMRERCMKKIDVREKQGKLNVDGKMNERVV